MPRSSLPLALLLAGCTYGAPATGGGPSTIPPAGVATIDVNLTTSSPATTPFGAAAAFTPAVTTVAVGTLLRFVNSDSFAHTASSFGGSTFPAASPLAASALQNGGATLSGGWSSGALSAGASSQVLLADRSGTYLYGCFFHYGAPMRGAIVVR